LLRETAAGSERAFRELRGRYGRAVARVCRSVAGAESEDCEQEVFARVWTKAALFDPGRGSAAAWLMTLARRTALNTRPARTPAPLLDEPESPTEPGTDDGAWLARALDQLSEHERTVIELAYFHDLTEREIAARLNAPIGSIKSWKRRGLNRLAATLGEEVP
jgi:RNA polymerase sigma-70 factor (ECF subfamily)